jgi:DNA-binding response OmpR family regulator
MPTVILLETDRLLYTAIAAFLTRQGYDVREAASARSALHILQGESVQAILLDPYPAPDGETLLRRIRSRPDLARIPVIAMLGVECGEILDYLKPGDHLHIPFEMQHLDWLLRKLLAEAKNASADIVRLPDSREGKH